MNDLGFNIEQVVDLLGLERQYNNTRNTKSFYVRCPFCDKKGYHLNVDTLVKGGVWRCVRCTRSGGMLQLYTQVAFGEKVYTKELGRRAIAEIRKQLNLGFVKTTYNKNYNKEYPEEIVLSDEKLDKVYSAMLDIPVLRLNSEHMQNLRNRGLTDEFIKENQYRTLPELLYLPKGKEGTLEDFKAEKLDELFKKRPELKRLRKKNLISGLAVAAYLTEIKDINLEHVPGFFTANGHWCFKYVPGILIPVRNKDGLIVNLQIRTVNGHAKYITNSSKGYENGTTGKTRIHFCKSNAEIDGDTKVFLTEGPLKADLCLSMMSNIPKYKNCKIAFLAVMGVNATKELSKTVEWLSSRGCRSVFNLLDMDKIINPYVANAAIKINKLFKKSDMELKSHFWDKETAKSILKKQNKLLEDNKLKVKYPNDDVFYMVLYNTLALKKKNIIVPDELQDWNPATKGFDDFLQNKYAK